jgi:hypothetical protein
MHPALSDFIRDVPELAPHLVALDREAAGGDVNACAKRAAIIWICEQPRSVLEKFDAIWTLERLPDGFVHFSMYQLTGWGPPGMARTLQ